MNCLLEWAILAIFLKLTFRATCAAPGLSMSTPNLYGPARNNESPLQSKGWECLPNELIQIIIRNASPLSRHRLSRTSKCNAAFIAQMDFDLIQPSSAADTCSAIQAWEQLVDQQIVSSQFIHINHVWRMSAYLIDESLRQANYHIDRDVIFDFYRRMNRLMNRRHSSISPSGPTSAAADHHAWFSPFISNVLTTVMARLSTTNRVNELQTFTAALLPWFRLICPIEDLTLSSYYEMNRYAIVLAAVAKQSELIDALTLVYSGSLSDIPANDVHQVYCNLVRTMQAANLPTGAIFLAYRWGCPLQIPVDRSLVREWADRAEGGGGHLPYRAYSNLPDTDHMHLTDDNQMSLLVQISTFEPEELSLVPHKETRPTHTLNFNLFAHRLEPAYLEILRQTLVMTQPNSDNVHWGSVAINNIWNISDDSSESG
ncbi:hypothetical protein BJ085DRAFT_36325 [Dimargaris cristalligena]|uniref:F-box domain-containing protein n=1 Tax=Dimargaris cristalligena TaxID=215637 RepID=A0A4P9ZY19_9FUNG|nr:hypothetical protein BJ085DRAFT_36325 [Dimargaris cristalligena]|eukprot:RKP38586.1 hypothetical protein BJ085DRAFT_36325 [Dimargaris cristalligena]